MALASLILSSVTLVTVAYIGYRTVRAADEATKATRDVQHATEGIQSATLEVQRATLGVQGATLGVQRATELTGTEITRLSAVTERVITSLNREARIRRIESVLDVLIEMRDYFNRRGASAPLPGSVDAHASIALCRKLETRLTAFSSRPKELLKSKGIADVREFNSNGAIEDAISEAKMLLRDQLV